MENLAFDLVLLAAMHATNDSVFLVMRHKLLGSMHSCDRLLSKKLFGSHRTWLGLAVTLVFGTVMFSVLLGKLCIWPAAGIALAVQLNSFAKRRLGMADGSSLPFFDQLDFFIGGALGLALCGVQLSNPLALAVLSGCLHIIANGAAYLTRLKDVWW